MTDTGQPAADDRSAPAAVCFDVDGVTVQSAELWRRAEETEILPAALATSASENPIRAMSVDDAYDRLREHPDCDLVVDRESFHDLYDRQATAVYRSAPLLPGIRPLVEDLRELECSIALVSASKRAWVDTVVDRHDLRMAVDAVVAADDLDGPSKPAPTPYERACTALGVGPGEAVAVEDSEVGVAAATAANLYCIALRGDGSNEADLSAADRIVERPRDLRAALLGPDSC